MRVVISVTGFIGFITHPFVDVPALESWPYLEISMAAHQVYFYLVCFGYRFGALSQVYPIRRDVAPVLVAIGPTGLLAKP
jgi:hypothetical protein